MREILTKPVAGSRAWRGETLARETSWSETLSAAEIADIERAHPNGDDVLVVCHGGVISAYLAHCLGLPLSSIWRLTVSNCSITELAPPRLLSMNVTTHLTGIAVPPSGFPTLSP